ncbi:MAG TPA: alginate lyase family protein [Bacteroidales bacterium]|nr:alginate lyase family protein [Bacteroidales bacterium]
MLKYIFAPLLLAIPFSLFSADNLVAESSKQAESEWVFRNEVGKLAYKTTSRGDKIMDFSQAGYMGGGVSLPNVPIKRTVKPSGKDHDEILIQKAIDKVSAMPLKNGFRGTVKLAPGTFICSGTLSIKESGVVLSGSGSGKNGTTILMKGNKHVAIRIGKEKSQNTVGQIVTYISDEYVPSGTTSFSVEDASKLKVGDRIKVNKPVTKGWVHFMEMDNMTRDGKKQTWVDTQRSLTMDRKIVSISGNVLTVDVPLSDSYDAAFDPDHRATIELIQSDDQITQAGVEYLHIQCPPLEIDYGHAPYSGIKIEANDCWVRDVFFEETMNTTTLGGNRITMQQVVVKHTYPNLGASKPSDFSFEGSQNLVDRCEVTGGNTYFVWTSSLAAGPNVVLNSTFHGFGSRIQPHHRWSTGLLVDNCTIVDGNIDFMNRGVGGSGHGWTMGWGVAWNCIAGTYIIQNPPGTMNWAIGCIGNREQTARYFDATPIIPEGTFDSHGKPVSIQSLYLAQLEERLGTQGLLNLGYAKNSLETFQNKNIEKSPAQSTDKDPVLGFDLAIHRPVNTSNNRGNSVEFSGDRALDGNPQTYWMTDDGVTSRKLEIDTEGPVEINALDISEAASIGSRVLKYKVEGQVDSDWKLLSEGTTIGARKVDTFETTTVWKVRLIIVEASAAPAISKVGLYCRKLVRLGSTSVWVYPGKDGKLNYKKTPNGDQIMDFSHAGYMGGGVALPTVPVVKTVKPTGKVDETSTIQAAIDEVAKKPLINGFRGAVLLAPGTYTCLKPINIAADGIVLRGSGNGKGGSVIKMTGERHTAISVGFERSRNKDVRPTEDVITLIADVYVPSGAHSFHVVNASGFSIGDWIEIRKPVTKKWIAYMQMNDLVRDGKPQTWIQDGSTLDCRRKIASISGNEIVLDVPVSDSYDSEYLNPTGTSVVKIQSPRLVSQVGIENLCIQAPPMAVNHVEALYSAIRMNGQDCWAKNLQINETMNSVGVNGSRITFQNVAVVRTVPNIGASKPAEFAPNAGQILLDRCSCIGDNIWPAATGAGIYGPIVLLNCTFSGNGRVEGHQRWTTGMLVDNCKIPDGGIDFKNRGSMGSGHGWGMGWSVAWNCLAKNYVIQLPPGVYNWMIGCKGSNVPTPRPFGKGPVLPLGISDSQDENVAPSSLYLAQLAERLGGQALANIGYSTSFIAVEKSNEGSEYFREFLTDKVKQDVRKACIDKANQYLNEKPVTVTASFCKRSAGGVHDFYSEGDYWWPDPKNPTGPYIKKDGETNPDNFSDHRHAMVRLSEIVSTLTSAWILTGNQKYADKALTHLNAWFTNPKTKMNPNLLYAQAISGRYTGRGIGLIDVYHLVEVAQSIKVLSDKKAITLEQTKPIKNWFKSFLGWMTTHPYGIDEMNADNNHGTCWAVSASMFAKLTDNKEVLEMCTNRFKNILLPKQMADNGGFPRELDRTKPFGYSLFNMDAFANLAQILSTPQDNLWEFTTPDGKSLKKGMEFISPFIADKSTWPYAKDIYIWDEWPARQSCLLFAGLAFNNAEYINLYLKLPDASTHPEVLRNLPVRHPIIWMNH